MKSVLTSVLVILSMVASAQNIQLTIEECYTLARQNYPLVKQRELIAKSAEYSIQNASKGYLPQLNINGRATYQSDVTQLPIQLPGVNVPILSKDQYMVYGEVNQTLYDGGIIKQQKESQKANAATEQQKVEVELYKLRERVNQLFFGVLLVDEQLKQNELLKNDIQLGLNKIQVAIANGTALKSSGDMLKAELLKNDQRTIELQSVKKAYMDMLWLFTGQALDEQTVLVKPAGLIVSNEIHRPELTLYDYQNKMLDVQDKMRTVQNRPRLALFAQGGVGRPALNFLSNEFEPYYIGGVRLSWSLASFYTSHRDRAIINVNRQSIALQKETFLFNTQQALKQQNAEISKLNQFVTSDDEIIGLRNNVKKSAFVQLENGIINSNDYMREVNAEDQARQNKILHQIQLLLAEYNQQTTIGISN